MSDSSKPFAFSQFVPGFDFLQKLAGGAAGGGSVVPGMPSLASWVAPTLSVEEVDKRIQELKTVQYWLEQNGHALKATIQALEVQKMTLSTLRGMNVRMEDLASAFTRQATTMTAPPQDEAPPPEPPPRSAARAASTDREEVEDSVDEGHEPVAAGATAPAEETAASQASTKGAGVIDPLQWWNALTSQFQQIASSALQDAAQLRMPGAGEPSGGDVDPAPAARGRSPKTSGVHAKAAAGTSSAARKSGSASPPASRVPRAIRKSGSTRPPSRRSGS